MMAASCCVAMGLGSDSARVNEVAKLCRAVVRGDGRWMRSEGASAGVGESWRRMVEGLDLQKTRAAEAIAFNEPQTRSGLHSSESVYHCV
jgi:hypothetical protein